MLTRPKITEERKQYIYILVDPREGDMHRYIGFTVDVESRYLTHLEDEGNTYKCNWLKTLRLLGLKPGVKVLETGRGDSWSEAEKAWIRVYRELCDGKLTNSTEGGEGTLGRRYKMKPEHLESMTKRVKKHYEETPQDLIHIHDEIKKVPKSVIKDFSIYELPSMIKHGPGDSIEL